VKKLIAVLLAACLLCPALGVSALAAEDRACAVVGADLTNFQTESVYAQFGVRRGSVPELSITVEEEREYLRGTLEDDVIGDQALSCVYIRLLPEGEGTKVSLSNITWCTEEMYRVALSAAGIHDVEAVIAAPFDDSGAAALAGIYKAYETLTERTIDQKARELGSQLLYLGSLLAEQIGKIDFSGIIDELKATQSEIQSMSDEELAERIRSVASGHGITLNDGQVQMLLELCRKLEGAGDVEPAGQAEETQDSAGDPGEKAGQAGEAAESALGKLKDFFLNAYDFITGLLGK